VKVSQPSAVAPLQLPNPSMHCTIWQSHDVNCTLGSGQWVAALTSQPSLGSESQSRKPGAQIAMTHVAFLHTDPEFGRLHTWPHDPQLRESIAGGDSHPLSKIPSQSTHPTSQVAIAQPPLRHVVAVTWGGSSVHPPGQMPGHCP